MALIPRTKDFDRFIKFIKLGDIEKVQKIILKENIWLSYSTYTAGNAFDAVLDCKTNRNEILTLLVESGLRISKEGLDAETMRIVRDALANGPKWRADAFELGITEIYIVRSKAWGIYFVPGDLQCPILYGGNYDGEYPYTAEHALENLDIDLKHERLGGIASRAKWFRPFLIKIVNGIDFPLEDVTSQIPDKRNIRN